MQTDNGPVACEGGLVRAFAAVPLVMLAALLLGIAQALGIGFIPFLQLMYVVLPLLIAYALGWVLNRAFGIMRIRNRCIIIGIVTAAVALEYYAHWVAWVLLICQAKEVSVTWYELAFRPDMLWENILQINHDGAFSVTMSRGDAPVEYKGVSLWICWGLGLLYLLATLIALNVWLIKSAARVGVDGAGVGSDDHPHIFRRRRVPTPPASSRENSREGHSEG